VVVFCGVDLCENWARVTCDVCKDIFLDTLTFLGEILKLGFNCSIISLSIVADLYWRWRVF